MLKNDPDLHGKLGFEFERDREDENLDEYRDLDIAPDNIEEWIILLGKTMASDKLSMIKAYHHTTEEVHNIAMRYAKTLKNCF